MHRFGKNNGKVEIFLLKVYDSNTFKIKTVAVMNQYCVMSEIKQNIGIVKFRYSLGFQDFDLPFTPGRSSNMAVSLSQPVYFYVDRVVSR